jgi:hypothetical protein
VVRLAVRVHALLPPGIGGGGVEINGCAQACVSTTRASMFGTPLASSRCSRKLTLC